MRKPLRALRFQPFVRGLHWSWLTQRTAEGLRESTSPQPSANESEEEVVLVEAPASAITSSLETLKADEVNYLGIAVDDSAAKEISNRFGARAGANYSTSDQDAFAKKLRKSTRLDEVQSRRCAPNRIFTQPR